MLGTVDDGRGNVAADVVVRSLARVGIVASPKQYPRDAFYATDVGYPANVRADGLGLIVATWTADFPTRRRLPRPAGGRAQHPDLGNTNWPS